MTRDEFLARIESAYNHPETTMVPPYVVPSVRIGALLGRRWEGLSASEKEVAIRGHFAGCQTPPFSRPDASWDCLPTPSSEEMKDFGIVGFIVGHMEASYAKA